MKYTCTFARLGVVAAGLSIGATTDAALGTASADSSVNWTSVIDDSSGLAALGAPTESDFQISVDGMNLFSTVGNDATATSGMGGIAIAWGDGASASATGGAGNFAFAAGSSATALAGGLSTDTGAAHNIAVDIGNNTLDPNAIGGFNGAVAGSGDLFGSDGGIGSNNVAINFGDNVNASGAGAYAFGGHHNVALGVGEHFGGGSAAAFGGDNNVATDIGNNSAAGAGAAAFNGDGNIATDIGNNTAAGAGAAAFNGNGNIATVVGNNSAVGAGAAAFGGNANVATDIANNDTDQAKAAAFGGDNNIAYVGSNNGVAGTFNGDNNIAGVIGPAGSTATAGGGEHNWADVLDPFGSMTSSATALGHNFDLAAILFADGDASVYSDDDLYDIVSFLGHEYGSFVAAGSDLLSQINALFAL